MTPKLLAPLVLLAAALGYCGGQLRSSLPAPAERAAAPAAAPPAVAAARTAEERVTDRDLRRELREALREELRAQAAPAPAVEPPAPPSGESEAAELAGQALVQRAVAAHRWRDSDVAELHRLFAQLDGLKQYELVQALVPAINRGQLVVETRGSPF